MSRARFIALEGGEGAGKSTQARLLADAVGAVLTREPGGTPLGRLLREVVLSPGSALDVRSEALLLAADRAQHVAEVVRPALEGGDHVVCDRYEGSFLAYQGWGRGLPLEELEGLSRWGSGGLVPDLVVLLDLDPEVAAGRRRGKLDRIEAAGADFHQRVRAGFRALAEGGGERWVVVDASGEQDEVAARVLAAVVARLGLAIEHPRGDRKDPRDRGR